MSKFSIMDKIYEEFLERYTPEEVKEIYIRIKRDFEDYDAETVAESVDDDDEGWGDAQPINLDYEKYKFLF